MAASRMVYNYLPKTYRVLHHQGLGEILRYSELPRRTHNFDLYPTAKRRFSSTTTLGGVVTTSHAFYNADAVIAEIWPANDLSMKAGFFYELLRFFNADLDANEHLLWYPADKTDKVFSVQPIDLSLGSADELELHPMHGTGQRDYRWLKSEVRFTFRVRTLYEAPNAVAYLEGA